MQELCPEISELRKLLRGELSLAEAAPLERHFASCPHCCERAAALEAEEPPLPTLEADLPRGEAIDRLMSRLGAIPVPLSQGETCNIAGRGDGTIPPRVSGQMVLPGDKAREVSLPEVPGYEVLEELGHGGMGVVYKARQVGLGRLVALKMILAERGLPVHLARFQTEAETVARLRHPNIVQVYEVGDAGGRPYLSLEFCEGGSLNRKLAGTPLPPRVAAVLLEMLARAMQAAHAEGIIHRDLKPANVLLQRGFTAENAEGAEEDNGGKEASIPALLSASSSASSVSSAVNLSSFIPKITDFGLAKRLDVSDGQTQSGDLLGTPSYMAPEQAEGRIKQIGPTTDVYALGAMLYEFVTGRPPFKGASIRQTLELVCQADPVPPRQLQPGVPRDLETICLKCLHKDPARRYGSAGELADDCAAFLKGEPIRARPVGWTERATKWVKRRPTLASLYAVVVLATGALLGLGFWFSARIGAARGELVAQEARIVAQEARTKAANQTAELHRFFSLVSNVRERSARPQPGWTWANLDDLGRAARLAPANDHLADLRTQAAFALGSIDVRKVGVVGEQFNAEAIAFHPNGRLLALGQAKSEAWVKCSILLIDVRDKSVARTLSFGTAPVFGKGGVVQDGVRSLAFSRDGRWLVAGMRGGRLFRWDLSRGGSEPVTWRGHTRDVVWLTFSLDGTALFSASRTDKSLKRWDCVGWGKKAGKDKAVAAWQAPSSIEGFCVSPSGWLACSIGGDKIHCLSPDTLQPLRPPIQKGGSSVQLALDGESAAWVHKGRVCFASLRNDNSLRTLRSSNHELEEERGSILLSPNGELLLKTVENTQHVKLWRVADGGLLADLFIGGGTLKTAFSSDSRTLAVTADHRTLLYEIGGLREQTFAAIQPYAILACALHPDGRSLVCLSQWHGVGPPPWVDATIWPVTNLPVARPSARHTFVEWPQASQVGFNPLSQEFAHTGQHSITFRDSGGRIKPRTIPGHPQAALCFAPSGRLWAVVGNEVRVWSPAENRLVAQWSDPLARLGGLDSIYAVAVGRRWALAGGRDGRVHLFRTMPIKRESSWWPGEAPIRSVTIAPDETLAVAGSDKGELFLVDLAGKVRSRESPHGDRVTALGWSGKHLLASGSSDRTVMLWRCSGKTLEELLTLMMPAPVRWLAFHPDGLRLFVLLEGERAIRVWHLDRLRSRLGTLGLEGGMETIQAKPLPPVAPRPAPVPPVTELPQGPNGLRAALFADMDLRRCVKVRYDRQINFDWTNRSPDELLPREFFSMRWTGWLKAPRPGRYTLNLKTDDGGRLWLDGKLRIDQWRIAAPIYNDQSVEVDLTEKPQSLRVEYFQGPGGAHARLSWARAGGFAMQSVPPEVLFHGDL